MTSGTPARSRTADPARVLAFDALREVHVQDAYANLVLARLLRERRLSTRDAAFATELFSGTCRLQGTYDKIIESASGRSLASLQPAVVDLLRLGTHQVLSMRVPDRAAVSATVELAAATVGRRVTGLVNAVLRKITIRSYDDWITALSAGLDQADALALRSAHPRWIVEAYADVLPPSEVEPALLANNSQPITTLAVRPGLASVDKLLQETGTPTPTSTPARTSTLSLSKGRWSPYAATISGDPGRLAAVEEGRAGVQDEGSQLVTMALARAEAPSGPWLDLCAGPGGKSALLAGLAAEADVPFIAGEPAAHRAALVQSALRRYPADSRRIVVMADGTRPAWKPGSFARVLADVPCTGLGALRRRPESRWRRQPEAVAELHPLQRALLESAIGSVRTGGVVAYITCSPHHDETAAVVDEVLAGRDDVELLDAPALLPEVPDVASGRFVQLWPHRHSTDAMFLALLRRS